MFMDELGHLSTILREHELVILSVSVGGCVPLFDQPGVYRNNWCCYLETLVKITEAMHNFMHG